MFTIRSSLYGKSFNSNKVVFSFVNILVCELFNPFIFVWGKRFVFLQSNKSSVQRCFLFLLFPFLLFFFLFLLHSHVDLVLTLLFLFIPENLNNFQRPTNLRPPDFTEESIQKTEKSLLQQEIRTVRILRKNLQAIKNYVPGAVAQEIQEKLGTSFSLSSVTEFIFLQNLHSLPRCYCRFFC